MLRLSKKAEYALMALKDLALRPAAAAASKGVGSGGRVAGVTDVSDGATALLAPQRAEQLLKELPA